MSQLNKWMVGGKISKLVVVITDKETGDHVERWQFDVKTYWNHSEAHSKPLIPFPRSKYSANPPRKAAPRKPPTKKTAPPCKSPSLNHFPKSWLLINRRVREDETPAEKSEKEIQAEIQSIFRQITASVTFLPQLDGNCTFNVLVYADADSDVPIEWGDSDAKEIKNGEKVQLRSFSTSNHRVDTLVSYR